MISNTGELIPIQNININDLGNLTPKGKVHLTHPDIPIKTINNLGIVGLRDRMIKGLLDIQDVDEEDEFEQRESVVSRIIDTLERYPIETTFKEYLANADDAKGASRISWLYDGREHPRVELLTTDMGRFQGPAFLAHNDAGKSTPRTRCSLLREICSIYRCRFHGIQEHWRGKQNE